MPSDLGLGLYYYEAFDPENMPVPKSNNQVLVSNIIYDNQNFNIGKADLCYNINTSTYYINITVTIEELVVSYSYNLISQLQLTTNNTNSYYSLNPNIYALQSKNYPITNATNVLFKFFYDKSTNQMIEAFSFNY